jgi:chromosome partitioning protein
VFESVRLVTSGPNPRLHLLGLVLTMVQPRLAVHVLYEQTLREIHGAGVFATRIPLAADIKEAISARKPITHYKPRGASAKALAALAAEIDTRLAGWAQAEGEAA